MATTKTVNVTTGKFLNYQVMKTGYKPVTGTVFVDSNKTIDVNLVSTESSTNVYSIGDRILNMASFVCYYKPGGTYDNKPISTAVISQTVGTGLKNLGIKKSVFESQISTEGTYTFTYDGTNWNYNSNSITLDTYGIFFNTATSTVSSGDTIQVVYTVYTKYACFVLDSNYRSNKQLSNSGDVFDYYPKYTGTSSGSGTSSNTWYYNQFEGQESATWCNQKILDNSGYTWTSKAGFSYCRELGTYILANGITLNALIPNLTELKAIYDNRVNLDSLDPVIQGGSTSYNLSNWSFTSSAVYSCQQRDDSYCWTINSSGSPTSNSRTDNRGIIPVFEVPCK